MLNNIVNPKAMSKKENKEQDILKAAEMLFAEKGFKGATTTLIAAQAGVTHAMLHYYFRTKDQIFLKVFDTYLEEILQSLKSIMVTDIFQPDLIRKTTEICFDFFSAHSGQLSLLLEVAKERPDLRVEDRKLHVLRLGHPQEKNGVGSREREDPEHHVRGTDRRHRECVCGSVLL